MTPNPPTAQELPSDLELAFLPLHKRNFGVACGAAAALGLALLTTLHLLRSPDTSYPLSLLGGYFYGYRVAPSGIVIGAFWAWVVGFVAGWFLAFSRNLAIASMVWYVRTRAELADTRDFLDHI